MKCSAFTTLAPEAKRTLSIKVSTAGTKSNGEAQLEKDGEKQKEPNLYHTKEKERNLMPEGLYLIVEEESLQKADCAVQQQNLCSSQWSFGSSLVPPINNDPRLVKEHIERAFSAIRTLEAISMM